MQIIPTQNLELNFSPIPIGFGLLMEQRSEGIISFQETSFDFKQG